MEAASTGGFGFLGSRWTGNSDAPVVGAPGLDALLDLLAGEFLLKSLLSQFDNFFIGGEAKSDQLVFRKLINLRMPLCRGESL